MANCANHKQCIETAMKNADQICKKRHLRFTPLRQEVLKMIWASHGAVKAYDILENLQQSYSSAKPPTVYRALDFLIENGLIHKLNSQNTYVGCTHPAKHKACYFLICKQCGEINECCNLHLDKAIEHTEQQNAFAMQNVTVEIEGTCQACRTEVTVQTQ